MMRKYLDRDKLSMVPRHQAADAAVMGLDGLQAESPEVQALGVGVLFAALCARTGLDPTDLWMMGVRVLNKDEDFHKKTNDSLEALRTFMDQHVALRSGVSIS